MKDKFKTDLERNTQMCDLVKSVDNGDDMLTKIDKCKVSLIEIEG